MLALYIGKRFVTFLVIICLLFVANVYGNIVTDADLPYSRELKVDLNPPFARKDILKPNWENWTFQQEQSDLKNYGDITITFRTETGTAISHAWYKPLLLNDAWMAADGITAGGSIDMVVSGLAPGKHTIVTYHNEVRDIPPTKFDVYVDDILKVKGCTPTKRAAGDYDIAGAFFEVDVAAGKDVVINFRPDSSQSVRSVIINGFEIDTVNPHKKAVKPSPKNDDEHVPPDAVLQWVSPKTAASHYLYLGTDPNVVARATPSSPEFKGNLKESRFPLPPLDHMKTYFWRVDEVHSSDTAPVRGDIWCFRIRFLAFPTAEGYGRFARGGRGGRVIEVTNLLDYDTTKGQAVIPGSYRAAIEASGPRTVIFRVSGFIPLKRSCTVRNPYITVAGQTAPGDGICLGHYSAGVYGSHDVIIRYIHCRVGDICRKSMDGMGMVAGTDHSIIDHCSISWTLDEALSTRGAKNVTFQRSIVSEALHHSYHFKAGDRKKYETHSFAASVSGNIGSLHHNLLAHCTDRNWSLAGGYNLAGQYDGYLDIRNNVVYNWLKRTTDGGVMRCNFVNNYYKPYPKNPYIKWLLKLDPINPEHGTPKYYMSGNVMEGMDYDDDNWKAFYNSPAVMELVRVDKPLFESYVTTQSARDAYKNVLGDVGANYPKQDVIDRRIIDEVRTTTVHYTGSKGSTFDPPGKNYPGIIDTQNDVKDAAGSPDFPWPQYRTFNVPQDTDHDGMPDTWEKKCGLDPSSPDDGSEDRNGDGYTNLEEYLGWLVGEFPDPDGSVLKTR